jgi:hypothetical protein
VVSARTNHPGLSESEGMRDGRRGVVEKEDKEGMEETDEECGNEKTGLGRFRLQRGRDTNGDETYYHNPCLTAI